ncbi:MAG: cytochrome P450 [Myxococcota bacterium]|jgi:cholest-4-en-3-one 26-monooxygenase|nr:cytochrome P450 [Myxococcota bacterium]
MNPDISYLAAPSWGPEMNPRLAWLRDNAPVYWSEKDQLWVITRFADVSYVSKDQSLFTSDQGVRPALDSRLGLIDEPEPRHGHLRAMINRGFTPRMVKKLEETFVEITTDSIDAIAKSGECDFVESIAVPLPLLLIAEMMGIHKKDRKRFHAWSDAMIAGDGNFDNPKIMAAAGQAFVEYSSYLTDILETRRQNPEDDLVSILVGAHDDGLLQTFENREVMNEMAGFDQGALANDELIMLLTLLMVAGNETTRNGISGGMQLLIENPEERQKLLDDPGLIPMAVEEMLRLVSPVHSFGRTVTQETELHGEKLLAGQKVLVVYPSANRDPRQFEDPEVFRIERNPSHLAFGVGSHFCLGANLARMEMRVAFRELLARLPDMEFSDGGPVIVPSSLVRSCAEMKVRFSAEA